MLRGGVCCYGERLLLWGELVALREVVARGEVFCFVQKNSRKNKGLRSGGVKRWRGKYILTDAWLGRENDGEDQQNETPQPLWCCVRASPFVLFLVPLRGDVRNRKTRTGKKWLKKEGRRGSSLFPFLLFPFPSWNEFCLWTRVKCRGGADMLCCAFSSLLLLPLRGRSRAAAPRWLRRRRAALLLLLSLKVLLHRRSKRRGRNQRPRGQGRGIRRLRQRHGRAQRRRHAQRRRRQLPRELPRRRRGRAGGRRGRGRRRREVGERGGPGGPPAAAASRSCSDDRRNLESREEAGVLLGRRRAVEVEEEEEEVVSVFGFSFCFREFFFGGGATRKLSI